MIDKIQKFITRVQIGCLTIMALNIGMVTIGATQLENRSKNYAEQNLTRIIKEQEQQLGIKYDGIPKIQTGVPEDENYKILKKMLIAGLYDRRTETIYLLPFSAIWPEKTLKHELGHFYLYRLAKKIGADNWFTEDYPKDRRIISEGVAEWFAMNSHEGNDSFCSGEVYHKGYNLVKPLLELYSEKGIEYLIRNPLQPEDLENLEGYQKRALDKLGKKD